MKFIEEFKAFALKGNVMDMAIGVIIGGAFGKIVSSLVNDIIMPPLGWLIGDAKFSELSVVLEEATETTEAVTWNYGMFIQNCVDFLLIALTIFIAIKAVNKMMRKKTEEPAPEAPAEPTTTEKLLAEIRDALKK